MAYKLEHEMTDHLGVLAGTIQKWGNDQPDVYIISEEGHKIYTQKLLVSFYSSTLSNILSSSSDNDIPGVSIPAQSNSIVNLLKVLATGIAISKKKGDLLDVNKTAEAMGIEMENWQIGVKNSGAKVVHAETSLKGSKTKKPKEKKAVSMKEEPVEESPSSQDKTDKKHSCADCGKQFGRKDHLNRHALTHSGGSFPCDACGSSFKRKDALGQHMSKVHDNLVEEGREELHVNVKVERNDTESNVGESVSDEGNGYIVNDAPVDTEHGNGDENSQNADLGDRELLDPFANEDDDTTIDGMGETVGGDHDETDATENENSLNQEDECKFSCSQCDKTFKHRNHLRRHEVSHSGIKFPCEECPLTFSRKDKLNSHMRKKHSQSTIGSENVPVTEESGLPNVDNLPLEFECPYCQKSVEDLAEHCMENHAEGKESA
eukprot:GFUD01001080.1.p1 GENE.GFUD01001080.1~~GFUD01001080.1.p1  ORF type:complete len:433 (+),score=92.93 GFUD01001080.1:53-1351(+)